MCENFCVFMEKTWEPLSMGPRMSPEVRGVAKVVRFYICWR